MLPSERPSQILTASRSFRAPDRFSCGAALFFALEPSSAGRTTNRSSGRTAVPVPPITSSCWESSDLSGAAQCKDNLRSILVWFSLNQLTTLPAVFSPMPGTVAHHRYPVILIIVTRSSRVMSPTARSLPAIEGENQSPSSCRPLGDAAEKGLRRRSTPCA